MVRPMVHSVKHYSQLAINQIGFGTRENNLIVAGVALQNADLSIEAVEGSTIKAVFFEMWLQNEGNLGEFIATISKDPQNGTGPTFAEMASLFTFDNKKNILWTSQGLTSNDGVSGPVNIIRQWIKIPKSKQRWGLGDALNFNIANVSSSDLVRCGFTTFKVYT